MLVTRGEKKKAGNSKQSRDLKQRDDDRSENVGKKNEFAFFQT